MSADLKRLLYHQICSEFEKSHNDIELKIDRYIELLVKIHRLRLWSVTTTVQGEDIKDPCLEDLQLLERSGTLEGKINYTHRNIEKVFTLTRKGEELINRIKEEKP